MDIRELRIGNSVLYDGERVKIDQIQQFGDIGLVDITYTLVSPKKLSPIPLTEKLLKELMPPKGLSESLGDYHVFVWTHGEFQIEVKIIGERTCVSIRMYDECNTLIATMMNIQYLHELETFVFLTTKKELI